MYFIQVSIMFPFIFLHVTTGGTRGKTCYMWGEGGGEKLLTIGSRRKDCVINIFVDFPSCIYKVWVLVCIMPTVIMLLYVRSLDEYRWEMIYSNYFGIGHMTLHWYFTMYYDATNILSEIIFLNFVDFLLDIL